MISVANMGGRFLWASASDKIGRKGTFAIFFCGGAPLYLSIPYAAQLAGTSDAVAPLVMFTGSTMAIFTMYGGGFALTLTPSPSPLTSYPSPLTPHPHPYRYGGGFATVPAYLADLFGTKYVGGIHGRLLTAWSTAGIAGPVGMTYLRRSAESRHITDLSATIPDEAFEASFGASKEMLPQLIDSSAVTIGKLIAIAPHGTLDPTPLLYTDTMYGCAGLLCVGAVANALIRPVHPSHHMTEDELSAGQR